MVKVCVERLSKSMLFTTGRFSYCSSTEERLSPWSNVIMAKTTQPNGEQKYCLSSFLNSMCKMRMVKSAMHLVGDWGRHSKCKEYKEPEIRK